MSTNNLVEYTVESESESLSFCEVDPCYNLVIRRFVLSLVLLNPLGSVIDTKSMF